MQLLSVLLAIAGIAAIVGFCAMWMDKRRAINGRRRVPERSFAFLSLLGGWAGILAGGITFRHKTRATGFKAKVAAAALLHACVIALLWRLR